MLVDYDFGEFVQKNNLFKPTDTIGGEKVTVANCFEHYARIMDARRSAEENNFSEHHLSVLDRWATGWFGMGRKLENDWFDAWVVSLDVRFPKFTDEAALDEEKSTAMLERVERLISLVDAGVDDSGEPFVYPNWVDSKLNAWRQGWININRRNAMTFGVPERHKKTHNKNSAKRQADADLRAEMRGGGGGKKR